MDVQLLHELPGQGRAGARRSLCIEAASVWAGQSKTWMGTDLPMPNMPTSGSVGL